MKFFPKNLLPQKISLPKNLVKITYNLNPILHNRIVLYFISLLALFDMIYFLNKGDIISFVTFVLIGFLTSFFSKNMIVIFVIALSITHILKYGSSSYVSEGFDVNDDDVNIDDEITENLQMNDKSTNGNVISSTGKPSTSKTSTGKTPTSKSSTDKTSTTTFNSSNIDESFEGKDKIEYSEIKKEYKEFQGVQDTIIKNLSDLEPALQKAEDFIKKFESYKEGLGQGNRGSP